MDSQTKNIIVKFVEFIDKKNLEYKNITNSKDNKENYNENSK